MKHFVTQSLFLVTLAAGSGHASNATYQPCLDYYQVGGSGCKSEPHKAQISPTVPPSPTAQVSSAPTLDNKIDDFLENHGKPPREFVAFYLDPTPDNAMKWISKYNELLDRNFQLTVAWTQAETLYAQALNQGVSPSSLVSSSLPPVPDFGISIPGFTDNAAIMGSSIPGQTYAPLGGSGLNTQGAMQTMLSGAAGITAAGEGAAPFSNVRPLQEDGRLGTPLMIVQKDEKTNLPIFSQPKLNMTYYFSAVCPYCKKFEPELEAVLESHPEVNLTCVDVTSLVSSKPSVPDNIKEIIPQCHWRLPTEGEINLQQVARTPTVLIQWGQGQPVRINGYVSAEKLGTALQSGGLLK